MIGRLRLLAGFVLALALLLTPAPASAQGPGGEQPAEEGEGGGDTGSPVWGYVATAFLASGAIFVLCKSARR